MGAWQGPAALLGTPPRRAGREMGQQVRGLASPQLRKKCKVRHACVSLVHGSRERAGERAPCSSRACGEPKLDTSMGRGDPGRAPHSPPSCKPQTCRHSREARCYREDRGTKVLPQGPCFIPPCSVLACAARWDPGTVAPAPQTTRPCDGDPTEGKGTRLGTLARWHLAASPPAGARLGTAWQRSQGQQFTPQKNH